VKSPFLGITKEMMDRSPHVLDIEYREANEQAWSPTIPCTTIQFVVASFTTHRLAHGGQQVLIHEVTCMILW
jgi:hypothetical protein